MNDNLMGPNHPNRVICPKCGKPGTKKSRMVKRGKYTNGPYFYVSHWVDNKVNKECYIGKKWEPVDNGMPSEADLKMINGVGFTG